MDELNGLGGVLGGILGIFVIHVCYFDVRKGKIREKMKIVLRKRRN